MKKGTNTVQIALKTAKIGVGCNARLSKAELGVCKARLRRENSSFEKLHGKSTVVRYLYHLPVRIGFRVVGHGYDSTA